MRQREGGEFRAGVSNTKGQHAGTNRPLPRRLKTLRWGMKGVSYAGRGGEKGREDDPGASTPAS